MSAQLTHDPLGSLAVLLSGLLCLVLSIWVYPIPFRLQAQARQRNLNARPIQSAETDGHYGGVRMARLCSLGMYVYWLHCLDWYTPVMNVAIAYLGTFASNREASEINKKTIAAQNITLRSNSLISGEDTVWPNIIFIQHESLSGAIMLKTDDGVKATPFFQSKMHNDSDFYVFENTRTGSGNTIDAMPALMTGCLPYTDEGVHFVQSPGRSIGYEFSRFSNRGYTTASFSSTAIGTSIRYENGQYSMLHDLLVGGMDIVKEPLSLGYKMQNADAVDDRKMLSLFEQWLGELGNSSHSNLTRGGVSKQQPFFAQMYLMNNQ